MTDLTMASDLLTLERPSVISARTRSRAAAYLPLSGRQAIRDKLIEVRRAVADAMASAGLDMIVDVSDVRAEGELWKVDDASWYWLASSNTNAIVLDENDVMRMHGLTLERILDRDSFKALEQQLELSRLPPDPDSNVAFERWHEQRVKNDVVWSYIRSHLPPEDRREDKGAPHARGRRLNMALNSVTMYMYMVMFNPSAYGTHVRKLLRGAMQFAAHHVLARYHLGVDTATYVKDYVDENLRPYIKDILSRPGIETQLSALAEEHAEHGDAYARVKASALAALERTALVRDIRTVLNENSVDTATRDPLFANLFSMYKLAHLIKALATYIADTSTGAATATDKLAVQAQNVLADVEKMHHAPAHGELLRHARKLTHVIRAFSDASKVVKPESANEPTNLVAQRTEHALLGMHSLAMLYTKAEFLASIAAIDVTGDKNLTAVGVQALATKKLIEYKQDYKQLMATMKALVSGAVRTLRSVRFSKRATSAVPQACAFLHMRLVAAQTALQVTSSLQSMNGFVKELNVAHKTFDRDAGEAIAQYVAASKGDNNAPERFKMNLSNFDANAPGKSAFGDNTKKTETSIAMISAFFLTGLHRTLHQVDKNVPVVVFKLIAERKPKSSPVEYSRAIKALRETLLKLVMETRDSVSVRHAASVSRRVDLSVLARSLVKSAESVIAILLDRIYETPIGLAFACGAANIGHVGEFPTGATPQFAREWNMDNRESLTADVDGIGSALFDSDLPTSNRIDLNKPYIYE
jgi:hypothetical protein